MNEKITLFIRDYQLKRNLINILVQLNIQFVECFEEEELKFKLQLFKEGNRLYIHEFSEVNPEEQYRLLASLKERGWKTLVIYPHYSVDFIDNSRKNGVDDMLVHPVDHDSLKNKVISILKIPVTIPHESIQMEKDSLNQHVKMEINRAKRGQYNLSFILIYLYLVDEHVHDEFLNELRGIVRETDMIIETGGKDSFLLICPFTPKNFLVEVENKVRDAFTRMIKTHDLPKRAKPYLYGLTYGDDGTDFSDIFTRLEEGIHDSRILDQAEVQNMFSDRNKLVAYKNIFKRI